MEAVSRFPRNNWPLTTNIGSGAFIYVRDPNNLKWRLGYGWHPKVNSKNVVREYATEIIKTSNATTILDSFCKMWVALKRVGIY